MNTYNLFNKIRNLNLFIYSVNLGIFLIINKTHILYYLFVITLVCFKLKECYLYLLTLNKNYNEQIKYLLGRLGVDAFLI